MNRRQIFAVLYAVIIYIVLLAALGTDRFSEIIKTFSWHTMLLAAGVILAALMLESLRWNLFCKDSGISSGLASDTIIFLRSLSFGILPAKTGELSRYAILKKRGIPFSRSVHIHFISNLIGLLVALFYSLPILIYLELQKVFILCLLIDAILLASLRYTEVYLWLADLLLRISGLRIFRQAKKALRSSSRLMHGRTIIKAVALTFLYQGMTAAAIYVILRPFGLQQSIFLVFSIYSLSLILGVLTMIPGGVGPVELSSLALLSVFMPLGSALSLIFTIRILTLWYPTMIGLLSFMIPLGPEEVEA